MASRNSASLALFFVLNILFFTFTAATDCPCTPSPMVPSPHAPSPPVPIPSPPSTPGSCPIDVLQLGACTNLLSYLLKIQLGQQSSQPCCSLLDGLVDLEAAVCLCTALKAKILGLNLNFPLSLSLLLNACNKKYPSGFQCA